MKSPGRLPVESDDSEATSKSSLFKPRANGQAQDGRDSAPFDATQCPFTQCFPICRVTRKVGDWTKGAA
jgi:hypothetical protein